MIGRRRHVSRDQLTHLAGIVASGLLALVVVVLVAFNLWTTGAIGRASDRAQAYGTESDLFQQAKFAVSEEESFERKYRLQPGPEWRAQHAAAAALLASSLNDVLAMHEPGATAGLAEDDDDRWIQALLTTHAGYLDALSRMFDAVDAGNTALVNEIDLREVDPAFSEIVKAVDTAASEHREAALAALADLNATEALISATTPVVLGVGIVLVVVFALVLRGYQSQVRRAGQRFQALVQNASDAVAIVDLDGTMSYVSPAASRVLRHDPAALEGASAFAIVHPDDLATARALLADVSMTPDQPRTIELRIAVAGDEVRDFEVIAINLVGEPAVRGIVVNYRDVSERKALERELKRQALHDELTGLPNRALFVDRLEHAIARTDRRAGMVAVLFVDLDHFKVVNDTFGHGRGDLVLEEVAARLRANVRKGETLARLGGDEFTILIDDLVVSDEAVAVAKRVLASLHVPIVIEGHEISITASIGIALAVPGQTSADLVLRNADSAMYRAKGDGRDCYRLFDHGMEPASIVH